MTFETDSKIPCTIEGAPCIGLDDALCLEATLDAEEEGGVEGQFPRPHGLKLLRKSRDHRTLQKWL